MKVKDLIKKLQEFDEMSEVVIPVVGLDMGPSPSTNIAYIGRGIDWDHGKVFLFTEDDLIPRKKIDVTLEDVLTLSLKTLDKAKKI